MFQGFNQSTIKYYESIKKDNSKTAHRENEMLYIEGVRQPLEDLYFELSHYFNKLDSDLSGIKRRCISSPYHDARFCGNAPIREYCYVRFKLNREDQKNTLGFFFDASLDGYKYGINIYNMNAKGMENIRDYILDNRNFATEVIQKFNMSGLLEVHGETYQKPNYPDEKEILRCWLEHKNLSFLHKETLNPRFFDRKLLEEIRRSFDSAADVYFMLKKAIT